MYAKPFTSTFGTLLKNLREIVIILIKLVNKIKVQQFSIQSYKQGMSSIQSINHDITFTLFVFDHMRELLKVLHPLSMYVLMLVLAFQMFKGFMITINHKFL